MNISLQILLGLDLDHRSFIILQSTAKVYLFIKEKLQFLVASEYVKDQIRLYNNGKMWTFMVISLHSLIRLPIKISLFIYYAILSTSTALRSLVPTDLPCIGFYLTWKHILYLNILSICIANTV